MEGRIYQVMANRVLLEGQFRQHGYEDFKWLDPKDIKVSQWVRMKCMYGCSGYGSNASCPPNVPSIPECRHFFSEYSTAVMFHFAKKAEQPEERHAWTREVNEGLLELERTVFLSGYERVFLLFMDSCNLCEECPGEREDCDKPLQARPTPEAMGVDLFSTVRHYGDPIEVLSDYTKAMNRYAFLMIE